MELHPPEASMPISAAAAIGSNGWIRYRRGYAKNSVIWKKHDLAGNPCLAIRTTTQGWKPNIKGEERMLTIKELKSLHSYGAGFRLSGAFRTAWSQVGNSVPPLMMMALARHLRGVLEKME